MKAIILAAGRGKRLKDKTAPVNKCMLNFDGKPLISYSLETARLSKVNEIIIVVGYRAEDIINKFGIIYHGIPISYVIQKAQKGLVHALECCKDSLKGDDFILLLGDEILLKPRPMEMIEKFHREDLFVVCGVIKVDDISEIKKTYTVIYNEDNSKIYRLIEKPRIPLNNVMGTGHCIFRNEIFNFIDYTPNNYVRNEKELPDLIQCSIDVGKIVKLFFVGAKYININTEDDIRLSEKILGLS